MMSNLFWLTDAQMARLRPFFPKSHGKPRVDDRRVLSGIIFINRNGLRWCDAPKEYGPPRPLQPLEAVERQGGLRPDHGWAGCRGRRAEDGDDRRDLSQGAPHGDQPAVEKGGPGDQRGRLIGRTKGGMNTKLHAVTDADGRPIRFFMTAGQVSDYTGAAALLGSLPKATGCWPTGAMTPTGSGKR
jgi:transposase